MAENNLESKTLSNLQESLSLELPVKIDESNKKYETLLKESNFKDDKLTKMFQEVNNSTGSYRERIEELTNQYIEEQKENNKLSIDDTKNIERMRESLEAQKILQEQKRKEELKQEAKENPLMAFKHAFDEFKSGSFTDTTKQFTSSIKESLNLKNIAKTALHGAGIVLDNPALNIIASEIKHQTENTEEEVLKTQNFLDSLKTKENEESKQDNKQEDDIKNESKTFINFDKVLEEELKTLESIKLVLEDSFLEHGSLLEKLYEESKQSNIYFNELIKLQKENLFLTKDKSDDIQTSESEKISPLISSTMDDTKEDDNGLLGSAFDMVGEGKRGKKGGKFSKAGRVGTAGRGLLKGGLKAGATALKALPVVGLLATAGMAIADGIDGFNKTNETFNLRADQEATASEKLASTLGGVVSGLSFGLVDAKNISKTLDEGYNTLKNISGVDTLAQTLTGTSDESVNIAKKLESEGVVDRSLLGDSRVNDWEKIKTLPVGDIIALKNYKDWSDSDVSTFNNLINEKNMELNSLSTPEVKEDSNNNIEQDIKNLENDINTKKQPIQEQSTEVKEQTIIVNTPQEKSTGKVVSDYNIQDADLLTLLNLKGIKV